VLILGASGTGKENLSRYIHKNSARQDKPYIAINCSAFSDGLLESRLFGYKKGAFTGADKDTSGLFEQAHEGIIFLDEIGDISPYMQQSLLRVLQEKEIMPLGGKAKKVDVRVIAATNQNLPKLCEEGKFRWDLYYRLSVVELDLPTLLERGKTDLKQLMEHFLSTKKKELHRPKKLVLDKEAQEILLNYTYPGNVRELENVVQRAVVLCSNNHIELSHLMFDDASEMLLSEDSSTLEPSENFQFNRALTPMAVEVNNVQTTLAPNSFSSSQIAPMAQVIPAANLQDAVKSNEHQLILTAIQSTDSRIEAARVLGISPRTLRYKMARLKLETSNMAMAG
jgi:transcriptional regulator with PAS, ATPase and Fis domain